MRVDSGKSGFSEDITIQTLSSPSDGVSPESEQKEPNTISISTSTPENKTVESDLNVDNQAQILEMLNRNTLITQQLCKNLNEKCEALDRELKQVKSYIKSIHNYQQHMGKTIGMTQKQMLFLLHCPSFPLEPGEPSIASWDFATSKIVDYNDHFKELISLTNEKEQFTLLDLIPEFFKPMALDFYHEMIHNISMGKDPKVAQMMFILNSNKDEIFVHMSCQPRFNKSGEPESFVTLFRRVIQNKKFSLNSNESK